MDFSTERNDLIDYLKGFAAILVVVGHALSYMVRLQMQGELGVGGNIAILLIYSVHVPLFFVIAGYLCHKKNTLDFYKSKLLRIFIPYVTFAILKLFYSFFISKEFMHSNDLVNVIFDAFVIGRLYWFAYCIFIMYLIAPLFWGNKNKKRTYIMLIVLCLFNILTLLRNWELFPSSIMFGTISLNLPFFQFCNLLNYLPYFLVGLILQDKICSLKGCIYENRKLLVILDVIMVLIITLVSVNFNFRNPFTTKFVLAFLLMYLLFLMAEKVSVNNSYLKTIGKYSYQIMFFDSFYKVILFKFWLYYADMNISIAVVLSIINILLACISCKIIERIPFVKILFGLR